MPFHLPSVAHLLFSSRTSWEFILNLDFEYSIITGKRKLAWATPVCPSLALQEDSVTNSKPSALLGMSLVLPVPRGRPVPWIRRVLRY